MKGTRIFEKVSGVGKRREEANAVARAESYTMVNVRPGDKVAAMIDVMSTLFEESPSALITDEISRRLAEYAASSHDNAGAILDAAEKTLMQDGSYGFQPGSALDFLRKDGLIEIENPISKQLGNKLLFKNKKPT